MCGAEQRDQLHLCALQLDPPASLRDLHAVSSSIFDLEQIFGESDQPGGFNLGTF